MLARKSVNLIVDISAFAVMLWLLSTGILLAFILPPRRGALAVLGLTRHEWGDLHLYVALAFVFLVGFHLLLHAQWIQAMLCRSPSAGVAGYRSLITVVFAMFVCASALWPLVSPVQHEQSPEMGRRHQGLRD